MYEWGERNWSAYVPDVDGCIATGKDRAQCETRIREALEAHLQLVAEYGDSLPEPTCESGSVTVAFPEQLAKDA